MQWKLAVSPLPIIAQNVGYKERLIRSGPCLYQTPGTRGAIVGCITVDTQPQTDKHIKSRRRADALDTAETGRNAIFREAA